MTEHGALLTMRSVTPPNALEGGLMQTEAPSTDDLGRMSEPVAELYLLGGGIGPSAGSSSWDSLAPIDAAE